MMNCWLASQQTVDIIKSNRLKPLEMVLKAISKWKRNLQTFSKKGQDLCYLNSLSIVNALQVSEMENSLQTTTAKNTGSPSRQITIRWLYSWKEQTSAVLILPPYLLLKLSPGQVCLRGEVSHFLFSSHLWNKSSVLDAMCWEHWDPDCPCPDLWGNCYMPGKASQEDSRLLAAPSLIHQGAQFLLWDFYSDRLLPLCLPPSLEPLHRDDA